MYYRQKILLALLQKHGGSLNTIKLQKLLFLFTRQQTEKSFDFVPLRYGCFSFQADHDLSVMEKRGYVKRNPGMQNSTWETVASEDFNSQLKSKDKNILNTALRIFSNYPDKELIRYTYIHYPYWAINSEIKKELLKPNEQKEVTYQKRTIKITELFSIGYEGLTLEAYLNILILNDVRLLCDVRKNALSKKYGFSKRQLKDACSAVGIDYIHIPQLGIISGKRRILETPEDYKILFEEYEKTTLKNNTESLEWIKDLLKQYKRVALTCFEHDPLMCHRTRITNKLKNSPKWKIPIKHL